MTTPPLAAFATGWTIPTHVSGQNRPVRIGSCVYGRYPGIFAYKVWNSMNANGLKKDGTWHKYGDSFDSAEEAYQAVLATDHQVWGD